MSEERESIVRYRLERARQTLAEAKVLRLSGHLHGCVNQLYYAFFYAVNALLLRQGLTSAKHTGVRGLFNHHFVKTGVIDLTQGELYNELYQSRQRTDYEDLARFLAGQVQVWA